MKMRISTESYRACNETFEGGGERREGREKPIVHLSVEVASPLPMGKSRTLAVREFDKCQGRLTRINSEKML
jgi:hypothetical protein